MKIFLNTTKIGIPRSIVPENLIYEECLPHTKKLCSSEEEAIKFRSSGEWITETSDGKYAILSPKEGYTSVFAFDQEEISKYKAEHQGSLAGFKPDFERNGVFGYWIPFDVDVGVGQTNEAVKDIYHFAYSLKKRNIEHMLFLSGAKGVHIMIPYGYFIYPESFNNFKHEVALSAAKFLAKEYELKFDLSIYNMSSMLRRPYTLNPKSGKPKVLFTIDFDKPKTNNFMDYCDIQWLDRNGIRLLNKKLHEPFETDFKYFDITPTKRAVFESHDEDIVRTSDYRISKYNDACVIGMLNDMYPSERHNSLLRIMSWLYLSGLPPKIAQGILVEWVNRLKPQKGKDQYTRQTIIDEMKAWGKYTYGCSDHYRQKYCSKFCSRYKDYKTGNTIQSNSDSLYAYKKYLGRDKTLDIELNEIFPGLLASIIPQEAHIIGIIGAPGVGKTLLLLQMMLGLNGPVMFFSYEMNAKTLVKYFCRLLGLDVNNPDSDKYLAATSHIWIEDSGLVTLDQHPSYIKSIEDREGIKFQMVCVDYIQNLPIRNPNNPTQIIIDETQSMNLVAQRAKAIAKQLELSYCYLSQVPKEFASGWEPITLRTAKGSGQLQAICDLGICLWRPHMDIDQHDKLPVPDNVLTVFVDKNRDGWEKKWINYEFDRSRLKLDRIYEGEIYNRKKKRS